MVMSVYLVIAPDLQIASVPRRHVAQSVRIGDSYMSLGMPKRHRQHDGPSGQPLSRWQAPSLGAKFIGMMR
jgi:hypothetical protein